MNKGKNIQTNNMENVGFEGEGSSFWQQGGGEFGGNSKR